MELSNHKLQEEALAALNTATYIRLPDTVDLDVAFYQWLLRQARSGIPVELVRCSVPESVDGTLAPQYFQHLKDTGAQVWHLPLAHSLPCPPFILTDQGVLLPDPASSGGVHAPFRLERQSAQVSKYQQLFRQYQVKGHVQSGQSAITDDAQPESAGRTEQLAPDAGIQIRFFAKPDYVEINQRFELSWEVTGADQVQIEPLLGVVPPKGLKILSAEKPAVFKLRASKGWQSLESTVNIKVNPAPKIEYLLSIPSDKAGEELLLKPKANFPNQFGVVKGQALRLYWRIYNAHTAWIDGQEVPHTGNMLLLPEQLKSYTIKASGDSKTVQTAVQINVFPQPELEKVALEAPEFSSVISPPVLTDLSFQGLEQATAFSATTPPSTHPEPGRPSRQTASPYPIRNFFWFCSGASLSILEKCPDAVGNRYVGIGAAVFFTGLLAALSGGYALYVAFENPVAALLFGLLWGAIIFNLDRLIVSTINKELDTTRQWRQALPRFLLALVLSVVIAKPLELRIFRPEILEILADKKAEKLRRQDAYFQEKMVQTEARLNEIKAETQASFQIRENLYQAYRCECDGTCGTGKIGRGSECERKEAKYRQADREYQALKAENDRLIASKRQEISAIKAEARAELTQTNAAHAHGLVAQLAAAQELPLLPSLFIALLIFLVEIAPVLSKLLTPAGAYERALGAAENRFIRSEEERTELGQTKQEQEAALKVRLHQAEIEQEVDQKREIMRLIAEAQVQLVQDQVGRWLAEQRKKLE